MLFVPFRGGTETDSIEVKLDVDVVLGVDILLLLPPPPPPDACCIRQWILNQFDLRPYREPDFDIPTMRHFRNLQALQAVRFFLLITHR